MKYVYSAVLRNVIETPQGFDTPEEAIIDYYKKKSKQIYDKIAKNKEYIRKAEQERRELYEKFKETIENNPHLMIV